MIKSFTLSELSNLLGGKLSGNPTITIQGVSSLCAATSREASYFDNPDLIDVLNSTRAGVVLLSPAHVHLYSSNAIVVEKPANSLIKLISELSDSQVEQPGVHPTAFIANSAKIGQRTSVGAYSVIGKGAVIADDVKIGAHCQIEKNVRIGSHTAIASGVTVGFGVRIGAWNVIDAGVVLGALPFNAIKQQGYWQDGIALGSVWLSDRVVIGANSTLARGSLSDTYIGENVRIDNLVHIAHDVTIGAHTAIAGNAVIGAFVRIGAHCVIGGASCLAANVHLAEEVIITGMSTVNKSLKKAGIYSSGTIVSDHQLWRRNVARFRRLDNYMSRFAKLEKAWQNDQE